MAQVSRVADSPRRATGNSSYPDHIMLTTDQDTPRQLMENRDAIKVYVEVA